MRKLIFLCRRRHDITHEEYARRVLDGHVPLALRHHPTMRRYVVNIVDRAELAGSLELDSIAELSFDTLEDYRERLYDSPEGEKIIGRDVAGFMGGADSYECSEHAYRKPADWCVGRRTPGVKMIVALKRKPELTRAQFVENWLRRHVPLALAHHAGLVHFVANVVDGRLSTTGEDFDGFAELGFATADAFRARHEGSPDGSRILGEDAARFLGPVQAWLASEHPQK